MSTALGLIFSRRGPLRSGNSIHVPVLGVPREVKVQCPIVVPGLSVYTLQVYLMYITHTYIHSRMNTTYVAV